MGSQRFIFNGASCVWKVRPELTIVDEIDERERETNTPGMRIGFKLRIP